MKGRNGHCGGQMCKVEKACAHITKLLIYFQIGINHKARYGLMIGFAEVAMG